MPAKKKKKEASVQFAETYTLTLKGTEKESSWTLFLDKTKGRYTGGFADGNEVKVEIPAKLAGKGRVYVGPGIRTRLARPSFLEDIEINSDTIVNVNFSAPSLDTKIQQSTGDKKLTENKLQEKVQEKKAKTQKTTEKNGKKETDEKKSKSAPDKKLLENKLKDKIEHKKQNQPKVGFWDRLK